VTAHHSPTVNGQQVARHLQPLLLDLIALSLNGKQAHWHVRGRHFTPLHEQLDKLVADARQYSDEVAERVVALGVAVDGRAQTVAEATASVPDGFLADDKVISVIVELLDAVIERARAAVEPLDELDLVSQDLLIQLLHALEKHRWMFQAQLDAG
jgi:starvation-inducible DNA-binding protein